MASLDIRTSALKNPIDVAEYLFARLHEVGVRYVHGVPGMLQHCRIYTMALIEVLGADSSSR